MKSLTNGCPHNSVYSGKTSLKSEESVRECPSWTDLEEFCGLHEVKLFVAASKKYLSVWRRAGGHCSSARSMILFAGLPSNPSKVSLTRGVSSSQPF